MVEVLRQMLSGATASGHNRSAWRVRFVYLGQEIQFGLLNLRLVQVFCSRRKLVLCDSSFNGLGNEFFV